MAKTAEYIINRLDKKLFGNKFITRSIEVNKYFVVKNALNEEIKEFDVQDVITGVVLDYKKYAPKMDKAGEYEGSSFVLILPISYEVSKYDEIVLGFKHYVITGINQIPIGETLVSQRVFVTENQRVVDPERTILT